MLALSGALASVPPGIRQCRDAHGRVIYQDQPCMGALRRADVDAPLPEPGWRASSRGCRLRSPLVQIAVQPPPLPDAPDQAEQSNWASAGLRGPGVAALPPMPDPRWLLLVPTPSQIDDDDNPGTVGLWLELEGSTDGVAIRIRGFQPIPVQAISFDTNIDGQGIRVDSGELIEVDSLDGPGSLRYGFRKSAILLRRLKGPSATLSVRIPGWSAQDSQLDALDLRSAVKRLHACVEERKQPA